MWSLKILGRVSLNTEHLIGFLENRPWGFQLKQTLRGESASEKKPLMRGGAPRVGVQAPTNVAIKVETAGLPCERLW